MGKLVSMGKFSKPNKYGSKRVEFAGYSFGSKLEAAVFAILKAREDEGEISDIKIQQRVYFFKDPDIYYIADFSFINSEGVLEYAEAKGVETDTWLLKRKLWIHLRKERLTIYKGSYNNPRISEVLN